MESQNDSAQMCQKIVDDNYFNMYTLVESIDIKIDVCSNSSITCSPAGEKFFCKLRCLGRQVRKSF